jgi:hypothetical protein
MVATDCMFVLLAHWTSIWLCSRFSPGQFTGTKWPVAAVLGYAVLCHEGGLVCCLNHFCYFLFDLNFHTCCRSSRTITCSCSGSSFVGTRSSCSGWLRHPCVRPSSICMICYHVWVVSHIRRSGNRCRCLGGDVWSVVRWVSHCRWYSTGVCSSCLACYCHLLTPGLSWSVPP